MSAVDSPCVKVCVMDPQRGLCIGCWRTLDEIAAWGGMSDAERRKVIAALAARSEQKTALHRSRKT
jgi:predicted Fe-S protein YdhL (DUF1289 family)